MTSPSHPLHAGALFNLDGAVALVTGGGTGIGYMCARALAANGAKVYISGRRKEVVEKAASEFNTQEAPSTGGPGKLVGVQGDVSSKESLAQLAAQIEKEDGRLHILVNNAGVEGPITRLPEQENLDAKALSKGHLESESFADWDSVFQVNNHSIFFSTMTFLPLLAAGNNAPPSSRAASKTSAAGVPWSAAVINITSISGIVKLSQNHYAYNASKASANALTRMLAHEFNFRNKLNIRVNAIAPGLFITEMILGKDTGARPDPQHEAAKKAFNPAGRAGSEEEMAQLLLQLAVNTFQQGQVIALDGGFITAVASSS